jgi:hypothetical protein
MGELRSAYRFATVAGALNRVPLEARHLWRCGAHEMTTDQQRHLRHSMLRKCDLVREDTLVSTSEIRGSTWLHRKGEDWQTPLLVLCHKGPVVFTPIANVILQPGP